MKHVKGFLLFFLVLSAVSLFALGTADEADATGLLGVSVWEDDVYYIDPDNLSISLIGNFGEPC